MDVCAAEVSSCTPVDLYMTVVSDDCINTAFHCIVSVMFGVENLICR